MSNKCCEKCGRSELIAGVIGMNHVPMRETCIDADCKCHQTDLKVTVQREMVAPKEEEWRNQEPWVSIEGAVWDSAGLDLHESYGVKGAMEDIKKYVEQSHIPKERVEKDISMLRQWLNEDRIDDPKKMVRNEDIKHFLSLLSEDK